MCESKKKKQKKTRKSRSRFISRIISFTHTHTHIVGSLLFCCYSWNKAHIDIIGDRLFFWLNHFITMLILVNFFLLPEGEFMLFAYTINIFEKNHKYSHHHIIQQNISYEGQYGSTDAVCCSSSQILDQKKKENSLNIV